MKHYGMRKVFKMLLGISTFTKDCSKLLLFFSLVSANHALGAPKKDSTWTHWSNCATTVYADTDGIYMYMRTVGYERMGTWTALENGDILATFQEGGKTINKIYHPRNTYNLGGECN